MSIRKFIVEHGSPAPPNGSPTECNSPAAMRERRAERYFEHDLNGQRRWYSEHARRSKILARALGIILIMSGAMTTFFQVFGQASWVPVSTAFLGVSVALIEGWRHIARYDETWATYQVANERMKRERRLYANGAGSYRDLTDEEAMFVHFVEAVEAIIAEEQQIYWRDRREEQVGSRDGDKTEPVRLER